MSMWYMAADEVQTDLPWPWISWKMSIVVGYYVRWVYVSRKRTPGTKSAT
jgi:hypothetical protein